MSRGHEKYFWKSLTYYLVVKVVSVMVKKSWRDNGLVDFIFVMLIIIGLPFVAGIIYGFFKN